jgi:dTDP-4-dehydrorhamnose 3,5-epimerase
VKWSPTDIPGVIVIEPAVYQDERGFFMETWQVDKFREAGLDRTFVQDNHSGSARNALRGLHYQLGRPQGKLVRVVAGEIFDVAVDLRRSSPTFGRWTGLTLSAENRLQLWVPEGFAHGYYVVSEWAEVIYKCTDVYLPAEERTLRWDDPDIGIAWPLGAEPPILSAKDAKGLAFTAAPTFP